jgi:hypothetical protein
LWMRCSFSSGPSCRLRRWIRSWRSSCPFEGIRGPGAPFFWGGAGRIGGGRLTGRRRRSRGSKAAWRPIPWRQRSALR